MKKELISVIMGVHNENKEFLKLAIRSICQQTYKYFEFIIIDDYSEESCYNILKKLSEQDSRIRLIRNKSNYGLTKTLNIGLSLAKGEYIARMDADDYSTPDRFIKQLNYLKTHPDIDVLGGGVISFGNNSIFMSPLSGLNNSEAQSELFFTSTLCHPSVIIRKSFLDRFNLRYDENVKKGQDYDLWERCSVYGKLAVMKDIVLYYRTHPKQITSTNKADQILSRDKIIIRRLGRIKIIPTPKEIKCHNLLMNGYDDNISLSDIKKWINKLLAMNKCEKFVDQNFLVKNLNRRLFLYKLRNKLYMSFSIGDCLRLIIVLSQRIRMIYKLKRICKNINY